MVCLCLNNMLIYMHILQSHIKVRHALQWTHIHMTCCYLVFPFEEWVSVSQHDNVSRSKTCMWKCIVKYINLHGIYVCNVLRHWHRTWYEIWFDTCMCWATFCIFWLFERVQQSSRLCTSNKYMAERQLSQEWNHHGT